MKAIELLQPWEKMPEGGVRILTESNDRDVALAIAFQKFPETPVECMRGTVTGNVPDMESLAEHKKRFPTS